MMKGMFKRALGVVAAAAMAVTGMAALSGTANAAEAPSPYNAQITFHADDLEQLTDRNLVAYRIGEYYVNTVDGEEAYARIQTIAGTDNTVITEVRRAANTVVTDQIADAEDPLAELMSRSADTLPEEDAPYVGNTRQFVTELKRNVLEAGLEEPNVVDPLTLGTPSCTDSENGKDCSVTVSLPEGVWVIYDDSATNASVPIVIATDHETKTATIDLKNQSTPDKPEKSVIGGAEDGSVSVGDTLTFQVKGTIPAGVSNYTSYTYVFTDKPGTGLTVDPATADIKINGKTLAEIDAETSLDSELTGNNNGSVSFTVTLDKDAITALGLDVDGGNVFLTYNATVNKEASVDGVTNKASVNNNGSTSEDGQTTVYTNDFDFYKKYADGTPAPTAQFVIKNEDGKFLTLNENGEWDVTDDQDDAEVFQASRTDGKVHVHGLADGVYTVVETVAATGAMDFKPSFTVTLTHDWDTDDDEATTARVMFADTAMSDAWDLFNPNTATVINVKNIVELPKTGAAGITMFVVLGLLIAGAGVTVYMKSRGVRNAMRA